MQEADNSRVFEHVSAIGHLARPEEELNATLILSTIHTELPLVNLRKLWRSFIPMFPVRDVRHAKIRSSLGFRQSPLMICSILSEVTVSNV